MSLNGSLADENSTFCIKHIRLYASSGATQSFLMRNESCSIKSACCMSTGKDGTLTQVVPDVHFSAQRSNFNDALAEEIVRFPFETLLHSRLDVVILIPHTHFNSVGGIVAFTERGGE